MVRGAISQIARFEDLERNGSLGREQAQSEAIRAVNSLYFGPDLYVWINDSRPVVLAHPVQAIIGRDVGDIRDADGRPLFREFLRLSAASGHGTVTYRWPRVNDDVPRLKISYVEGFAPWDWTVGAGAYVDDIDAAYDEAARRFGLFALLAGLAAALVAWLVGVGITRPLKQVTRCMTRLAAGESVEVPQPARGDEMGDLMRALGDFKRHLSEKEQFREAHDSVLREAGTVFNLISDAVMVTDRRNHIKLVNPAFTRITGFAPDEVIGRSPSILSSGRHDKAFYAAMWEQLSSGGSWSGEVWNRAKSGEVFPEWLSIVAIRDRAGEAHGYVATFSNIAERKRRETRMRWQAEHDALTGLANRVHFETALAVALSQARQTGSELAVLFISLEGFKEVADTLGRAIGDPVLSVMAKRLRQIVRADDVVARLGGDEFAVIIPMLQHEGNARFVAGKIVSCLAEPVILGNTQAQISANVGVAIHPHHGTSPKELLSAADHAIRCSKQAGRSGIAMAEAAPSSAIRAS
ncbi:Methyl-accepting chemotaxis protein [Paramagnetospirillum magneticum AMB-1]|uniref:Methyl-accepting chemotaxis protein n=2 Tax=Paramagnetospirillum magneticum TaxID=84159 RepID=Q2W7S3_PARM1|nr:Methyl-accepting chemotaxis protein [Paramagnetospirillum magneticum AMB-1]